METEFVIDDNILIGSYNCWQYIINFMEKYYEDEIENLLRKYVSSESMTWCALIANIDNNNITFDEIEIK